MSLITSKSSPVQLSAYTTLYAEAPKQVSGSWSKFSVGDNHVLAINSRGLLYSWGSNTYGQLGDISNITRSSPVQVGTNTWRDVKAGTNFSLGIKGDNTLWAWGNNTYGQLGNNGALNLSLIHI
jgi:alpha-tubulin suppressor-like RCC1 family protein